MNKEERERLEALLEEALAILRGGTEAAPRSGGTGNGPPDGP